MKKLVVMTALAAVAGSAAAQAATPARAKPTHVTVTPETLAQTPVSELLYSNFIELGYGYQVEPMMTEMLFNRSFETYTPYNSSSWYWYGLFKDKKDESKGVITDWRDMVWYHSGYEHNEWFAAPGAPGPFHIDEDSTYFIAKSPVLNVEFELTKTKEDSRHGTQALRLLNHEQTKWGALAQEGKLLRKGQVYKFSGLIKSDGGNSNAELRLYPRGKWDKPIVTLPLSDIGKEYSLKTAQFRNDDFDGDATFSLWIPPQSSITVDDFSFAPEESYYGWRPDAVEISKKVGPKLMRFPGGCFAALYDWREGIGPREERVPKTSYSWGGMNYNDIGTDEFAMFSKAIGAEMMFCINMYHPRKQHLIQFQKPNGELMPEPWKHGFDLPEFADPDEGLRSAVDWVAYCNLPAGTHPMADLRAKNGFKEPFGVKYWECDNESFRWMTAEDYARDVIRYSRAMKAVDPTIQIGLTTYAWGEQEEKAIATMLEICGKDIDFLADRGNAEEHLDSRLKLMHAYNKANGTTLKYANTEWFPWEDGDFNVYTGVTDNGTWSINQRWAHAMFVLKTFMSFQRRGGDVLFVNYNNFANTHAQCVIETPREGVYMTADGMALSMISRSPAAWPLQLQGYKAGPRDDFQVQAAWDKERKRLVLYVLNRTAEQKTATFDISQLERNKWLNQRKFKSAETRTLYADDALTRNTMETPDAIKRKDQKQKGLRIRDEYSVTAQPWSFVEVILD